MSAHVTLDREKFAKVRALHDSTTIPGEKAAAAAKLRTLAGKAGLTVEEAVFKLEAAARPGPKSAAQAAADAFSDHLARRERERTEKWRRVVEEYGSEGAVFAPGEWERALEKACSRFVVRKATTDWRIGSLLGWYGLSTREAPTVVREAVATAYPMPQNVQQAWAEFRFWEKLAGDREARGVGYGDPVPSVELRCRLVEELLNALPARSMNDLRARLSWMEHLNHQEMAADPAEERSRLATLRADIERMGERIRKTSTEASTGEGQ